LVLRRALGQPHSTDNILFSKRFASDASAFDRSTIGRRVSRPEFAGYWVCKGKGKRTVEDGPSDADITVLWIHGGGYISGHPLANTAQMLRITEIAYERNITVAVFALEYTLAPEAVFPCQINQAMASYLYLLEEMEIEPSRIVITGSSAGGHLALALLYEIANASIPRPGKAMLLYPWVNLNNSGISFKENRYKDGLSKDDLDRCASWVLGEHGREYFPHVVDFASSSLPKGLTWSHILPSATWVTVGSHDLFLSDVENFVRVATADGATVDLDIEKGSPHGWLEYYDAPDAKCYLDSPPLEEVASIMPGAQLLAAQLCNFCTDK
jgi:acetyl esterase/lipase